LKKYGLLLLGVTAQLSSNVFSNEIKKMDPYCYKITHSETASKAEQQKCLKDFIEEVVVTGTRVATEPRIHPGSLSVVDQQDIQRTMVDGAAELLRDIPGIQISDAGQAGTKRLRIRGEESRRIAILVDNQEITDHREVGVPITLDPEIIERVEVVRGASSVLYGSKAIGGVVNFITKKGGYHPLQGVVSLSYDDSTSGTNKFVSLYGAIEDVDYRLSVTDAKYSDRESPEGEIENTRSNSESVSFYAGWDITEFQRFEINYTDHKMDSEVFVEDDVRTSYPFIDFAIDAPQRDREKIGVFYQYNDISDSLKKIEINAYRQESDRRFNTFPSTLINLGALTLQTDASIFTTSELVTDGALIQTDWNVTDQNYLIIGAQYLNDEMEQDRLNIRSTTTTFNFIPLPPSVSVSTIQSFDEAEMRTLAAFIQNEWAVTDDLKLTFGARNYWVDAELSNSAVTALPKNSVDDEHLVVAFSALYTGHSNFVWRFNASEGYVYPSLLQIATGAYAGSSFVSPNPNLTPETSDNFEIGMRYFHENWILDLTAFYSESEDYIDHVPCSVSDNCINLSRSNRIYKNVGESTNQGLEALLEYDIVDTGVTPYLSMAWMVRENEYSAFSTKKTGWPRLSGRTGIRYENAFDNSFIWLDGYVRAESSADEEVPSGASSVIERNSGWSTFNLSAGIDLGKERQYKAALHLINITDKTYSTASENLLAPERHVRLKLTAKF